MITTKELLTRVERAMTLASILNSQLAQMRLELQSMIGTGQAVTAPNVAALHSSVMSTVSRGGGRTEIDQCFIDWREACGLAANGEAKANGESQTEPKRINGEHCESNGKPRLDFTGDNWLRML